MGVGTCLTQRKSGKEEELTQDTPNEVRGWSLESREHFLLTRDKRSEKGGQFGRR